MFQTRWRGGRLLGRHHFLLERFGDSIPIRVDFQRKAQLFSPCADRLPLATVPFDYQDGLDPVCCEEFQHVEHISLGGSLRNVIVF